MSVVYQQTIDLNYYYLDNYNYLNIIIYFGQKTRLAIDLRHLEFSVYNFASGVVLHMRIM